VDPKSWSSDQLAKTVNGFSPFGGKPSLLIASEEKTSALHVRFFLI
jgi:hypothetical protein